MAKQTIRQRAEAGFGRLRSTAEDVYVDVTSHWRKPAKGNFLSYKEIGAYSVGGMGVNMIAFFIGHLGFNASSMLLAATIGLRPIHLQTMVTLQTILNLFFYVIRGKLVDNTRTKWGRFRPYIAVMGLPLTILTVVYLFLPFETMQYTQKLYLTFAFGIAVSMLSPLLTDTFGELGSCMSPNTVERTKMFTIYSLVFSFAPTVYNFLIPIFSDFTGGYTNIATYRYVITPVGIMGLALVLVAAIGCKERVVTSESYVQKVGIVEGCVAVWKNKYWWIRNISGIIGFLEGANGVLFSWIYIYSTQDMTTYAFLTTIMGSASGIAMLITPWLLSKLGNKRMLLFHNAFNILMVIGMLASYRAPLLFFVFMYFNSAVNNTSMVYAPVHAAEVKDSIQYQSGFRVDFTLGAAGMITLPITILTGYAIPFVYEAMGLTFNYNVLYDPLIRNNLFYVLCILSIIGAALNLIPFFFYGLSREKHRTIYAALKYRAVNSDYGNGKIDYRDIKETVELYNEMMEYNNALAPDVKGAKRALWQARMIKTVTDEMKQSPDWQDKDKRADMIADAKADKKAAIKAAKAELKQAEKIKSFKEALDEVFFPEINKYTQPLMIAKVEMAAQVANAGINGLNTIDKVNYDISNAALSKKDTKKAARYLKKTNKKLTKLKHTIAKRYPNGVQTDYWQELQDALNATPSTPEEKKLANRNIKEKKKAYIRFRKAYKFYFACQQLKNDSDSSTHYSNYIAAMYDEAAAKVEVMDEEEMKKDRAAAAAQKAELNLIRAKKSHKAKCDKAAKEAKKNGTEFVPAPFDPASYGLDEHGYALRVTGDELQSILDLNSARRAMRKAISAHTKSEKAREKEAKQNNTQYTPTPFNAADYGIDELGYPLNTETKSEEAV